jgi:hypothetical protein
VEGVVISILRFGWDFYRTNGVQSSNPVVNNNLKSIPTPYKIEENQPQKTATLCTTECCCKKKKKALFIKVERGCEGWGGNGWKSGISEKWCCGGECSGRRW